MIVARRVSVGILVQGEGLVGRKVGADEKVDGDVDVVEDDEGTVVIGGAWSSLAIEERLLCVSKRRERDMV